MIVHEALELPSPNSMLVHLLARNMQPAIDMYIATNNMVLKEPLKMNYCIPILNKHNMRMFDYLSNIKVGTTAEMQSFFTKVAKEMFNELRDNKEYYLNLEARIKFFGTGDNFKILSSRQLSDNYTATYYYEVFRSQMVSSAYLCIERLVILDDASLSEEDVVFEHRECTILHDDVLDEADIDTIMKRSPKKLPHELLWVMDTYIRYPQVS